MKEEFCKASACPITKTAGLLSDTWTMLVVRTLMKSPKRFSELESDLEGISTRTLIAKLRTLEEEALIQKSKDGEYCMTSKGKALRGVLLAMGKFGKKYL